MAAVSTIFHNEDEGDFEEYGDNEDDDDSWWWSWWKKSSSSSSTIKIIHNLVKLYLYNNYNQPCKDKPECFQRATLVLFFVFISLYNCVMEWWMLDLKHTGGGLIRRPNMVVLSLGTGREYLKNIFGQIYQQ